MMSDLVLIESEESENSVVEVEIPKKTPPPVINIDDDELILNIGKTRQQQDCTLLAKDIIHVEEAGTSMSDACTSDSQQLSSPDHWTSDMIKFYNDDWGGEELFVVEKIQEKMDKSPWLWEISRKDLLFMHGGDRKNRVRCWNCCQYGHTAAYCPDPPHIIKCHMCGTPGHSEKGCPKAKCLNCGNYTRSYTTSCSKCRNESKQTCSRCQLVGHNFINCSDHWRLYHSTVGSESIRIPDKNIYKPVKDLWCCNCGRKGHVQNECSCKKDCAAFADFLPFVVSYQKAFNSPIFRNNSSGEMHRHNKRQKFKKDFHDTLPGTYKKKKKGNFFREKILGLNPNSKKIKGDKGHFKGKFYFKKSKKGYMGER